MDFLFRFQRDSSCFPEFVELFGRAGGFDVSSPDFVGNVAIQLD